MTSAPPRRAALFAFLVCVLAGGAVWALSPLIAARAEPWDAEGLYYPAALSVAGFVSGGLAPRPLWAQYLGAVTGPLAYQIIFLEVVPLLPLGLTFLLAYTLVFLLAAAALAGYIRLRFSPQPPAL